MLTPETQIVVCFVLRLAVSMIQHVQGRQKSEMHRITPTELEYLTAKSTIHMYIHQILTPEAQILVSFTLRLAVSDIHVQGR